MKISIGWLNEFVDVRDLEPKALAERLTLSTSEIEGVDLQGEGLGLVVAARVLSARRIEGSDHLHAVEVESGSGRVEVVCGAPRIRTGAIAALATPGSTLPDGREIRRAKVGGVMSDGMLCSPAELGLGEDASGLLWLPDDTPLGCPLPEVPGIRDAVLEIDNKAITHRPDLWGHYGFAREVAALYGRELRPLLRAAAPVLGAAGPKVTIESPALCPRYIGLAIRDVTIAESPFWLRRRLESVGIRSISNLVDLTNYVMLELGQPLHAFDYARLRGPEIRVRTARPGETLKTLDGVDRALPGDALVIADRDCATAIAGIMGGAESEISSSTRDVLLESANFDPVGVRRASVRLGLRTEAVARFEKSLDPELALQAVSRFVDLFPRAGVRAGRADELTDAYARRLPVRTIRLDAGRVERRLGAAIGSARIASILRSLSFGVAEDGPTLDVTVPSFRATKDVTIEDDLVEEVGRVHGYANVPPSPPVFACVLAPRDAKREIERPIRTALSGALRFTEVLTYSFAADEHLEKLGLLDLPYVRLSHPTQQNMARLRRDLAPALIATIEPNLRVFSGMRFYEIGRTYWPERPVENVLPDERRHVTGVVVPQRRQKGAGIAFASAKEAVVSLLEELSIGDVGLSAFRPGSMPERPWIHPTRSMIVTAGERTLGYLCELHPRVAKAFDVKAEASLFDLEIDALVEAPRKALKYVAVSKYPAIKRDVSVNVPKALTVARVGSAVRAVDESVIHDVRLIEIFTGGPIPDGMKNLAFHIEYRSPDRTLRSEEADAVHARVVAALRALGGIVRGQEGGG